MGLRRKKDCGDDAMYKGQTEYLLSRMNIVSDDFAILSDENQHYWAEKETLASDIIQVDYYIENVRLLMNKCNKKRIDKLIL